jgi:hypothetical protein
MPGLEGVKGSRNYARRNAGLTLEDAQITSKRVGSSHKLDPTLFIDHVTVTKLEIKRGESEAVEEALSR